MRTVICTLALLCCTCIAVTSGQHSDQDMHSGGNELGRRSQDQWSQGQRSGDAQRWDGQGTTQRSMLVEPTQATTTYASATAYTTQRYAYPTQRYYGQYGQYDTYTTQRSQYSGQSSYDYYTTRSPYYQQSYTQAPYTQAPYYQQSSYGQQYPTNQQSSYGQQQQRPQQPQYGQGSSNYNPYGQQPRPSYPYPYPSAEPQLRSLVLSHNSVYLWWSDRTGSPAPAQKYQIRYNPSGQTSGAITKDVSERELLLSDLQPGTNYEFALRVDSGSWGRSIQNRTLDTVPSAAPSNVRIVPSDSDPTSAVIHLPRDGSAGQVDSYLILYAPSGTTGSRERAWLETTVQGGQTQAVLRNLVTNMEYFYTVQARNRRGYGPFSDTASFTTGGGGAVPYRPPYFPTNPYTRPPTDYHTTADPYRRDPYNQGYDPYRTSTWLDGRYSTAATTQSWYDRNQQYQTTQSWDQQTQYPDYQTTRPYWQRSDTTSRSNGEDTVSELAPAAPKNLFVMQADVATEALVSFDPPEATNGEILSYELRYTHDPSAPDSQWTIEDSPDAQISVSFLHPNQQYSFKIRARNDHGFGPYSEIYMYSTDPNVQNPDPGSGSATVGFIPSGDSDQDAHSPTDTSADEHENSNDHIDTEASQQRR